MSEDVLRAVKDSGVGKVKLAVTDIDGVLRGKVIHEDKFASALEGGFGFCNVIFGWDSADECYDNTSYTGWHTGYPDALAKIDPNTYRKIPWEGDLPFLLADFSNDVGEPLTVCPRQLLKRIRERALEQGFSASFAQEFEWFNFRETSENLHDTHFTNPEPLSRGMFGYSLLRAQENAEFFNALFDLLGAFRVPLEGLHTETGPGVYEAAILYDDILEAADRAVLFKGSVKEIGKKYGVIPSFMAKWNAQLPGCSGHLHQSLWSDGRNLFHDPNDELGMSSLMGSYIAGLLHCLPHLLPMYAPTVNSFKRLVEGLWAPTTLTWAIDNRTVCVRALPGSEKATRCELRVVGADVNPYLAMAASLASGLYGIAQGLKLEQPETKGNGYQDKSHGTLPSNLWDATQAMKRSDIANELLGEEFVQHFCATREWEWREYGKAVTDWELKRYFEVI